MPQRTDLTITFRVEVVRTEAFTATAAAHGIRADEQDAITRFVAYNAASGQTVFKQSGYWWRSILWRDALFVQYLEEPCGRINLLCVDNDSHPHGPTHKRLLRTLFEKIFIAGLVEGAKNGVDILFRRRISGAACYTSRSFLLDPSSAGTSLLRRAARRPLLHPAFPEGSLVMYYRKNMITETTRFLDSPQQGCSSGHRELWPARSTPELYMWHCHFFDAAGDAVVINCLEFDFVKSYAKVGDALIDSLGAAERWNDRRSAQRAALGKAAADRILSVVQSAECD